MTFGSNRAFWFETTAASYPYIVKPDGSHSHSFRRKAPTIFNLQQGEKVVSSACRCLGIRRFSADALIFLDTFE